MASCRKWHASFLYHLRDFLAMSYGCISWSVRSTPPILQSILVCGGLQVFVLEPFPHCELLLALAHLSCLWTSWQEVHCFCKLWLHLSSNSLFSRDQGIPYDYFVLFHMPACCDRKEISTDLLVKVFLNFIQSLKTRTILRGFSRVLI